MFCSCLGRCKRSSYRMLVISHRRIQTAFHNILYHSGYDNPPTPENFCILPSTCFDGRKEKALGFLEFFCWCRRGEVVLRTHSLANYIKHQVNFLLRCRFGPLARYNDGFMLRGLSFRGVLRCGLTRVFKSRFELLPVIP